MKEYKNRDNTVQGILNQHLLISRWNGKVTASHVEDYHVWMRQCIVRTPSVTLINIIEQTSIAFTPEFRETATRILGFMAKRIRAEVLVVELDGFRSAIIRSFLSSIPLVFPAQFPRKVFSSLGEAVPWLRNTDPEAIPLIEPSISRLNRVRFENGFYALSA